MSAGWIKLDNAAKIFPAASNKEDTKVFRFACELSEPVDADMLQEALRCNLALFPSFQCVMRRGLFWYYLEQTHLKPTVHEERDRPCSILYDKYQKKLLFEVTYHKNRINFEVYHAITDGTGALHFMRGLVYHYIKLKFRDEMPGKLPHLGIDATDEQMADDSFSKYYDSRKKTRKMPFIPAFQLRGIKLTESRLSIIEGHMPVKAVLDTAHAHHTTVTALITAVLIDAILSEMSMRDRKKPVTISIPVNLRNYFSSESFRNFFSVSNMICNVSDSPDFQDILRTVEQFFKNELNFEQMASRVNTLSSLENHAAVRMIPLVIKDVVLKAAHDIKSLAFTCTLSNVGRISMPEPMKKHIRYFDLFVSTKKMHVCMCSFEEVMSIAFSSRFVSHEVQKNFFRKLAQMDIPVTIATNRV